MKKTIRLLIISFAMLILSIAPVLAGGADGSVVSFKAGAKTYAGYSHVLTNGWAWAFQYTKCKSSDAKAGWLGSKASLYYSSGVLKHSSSWDYNSKTVTKGKYHINSYGYHADKGKSFYSKGKSRGWNASSSSYVTKNTPKSPNQTN